MVSRLVVSDHWQNNTGREVRTVIDGLFRLDHGRIGGEIKSGIEVSVKPRKIAARDVQPDAMPGANVCYDDVFFFSQKMTPKRYPMSYKVAEEREFLVPAPTEDGAEYVSSNGCGLMNHKFERRPLWAVECISLDKNYVYSKRVLYVDQEMLSIIHSDCYDQKGRLYRALKSSFGWNPDLPYYGLSGGWTSARDHVDVYSDFNFQYLIPGRYEAKDLSLRGLLKRAK